jgi:L,D-transpeptidase catalytic domain
LPANPGWGILGIVHLLGGVRIRDWISSALVAAAVVGVVGFVVWRVGDGNGDSADGPGELKGAVASTAQLLGSLVPQPPEYGIAHPTGSRVDLHSSPDGDVIARLGAQTEFGSPRTFLVAETRGDWMGVVTPKLPNGKLAWLKRDSDQIALSETRYSIHVDLSARALEVRHGNDVMHRARVSIGRAGHRTPVGLFSVTDALAGRGLGPWYGCCALATSGHQPRLPPGWIGGDRIAIHGTPGPVGGAVSTGCLRTANEDMVVLFSVIPLGAPLFIHG